MFAGMKRRGLRTVVSRGPEVDGRIELTLICGHTVSRAARNAVRSVSSVCRACAAVDGKERDAAKAIWEAEEDG